MAPKKSSEAEHHSIPLLSESPDDEEQQRSNGGDPLYAPHSPSRRLLHNRYPWIVAVVLLLLFIGLLAVPKPSHNSSDIEDDYDDDAPVPDASGICKQSAVKELPDDDISKALANLLRSDNYRQESTERLSRAVQIPTESFDDMGPVGEDKRWDIFQQFHDYLSRTYPQVYDFSPSEIDM
jgi:Gly-Xaa carboxypeptidase